MEETKGVATSGESMQEVKRAHIDSWPTKPFNTFDCAGPDYSAWDANRDEVLAKAVADGMEVVGISHTELGLDLDTPTVDEDHPLCKSWDCFVNTCPAKVVGCEMWHSRSGNVHVVIKLDTPISDITATTWEMALGSDPVRGALTLRRINSHIAGHRVLFRPRGARTLSPPLPDPQAPEAYWVEIIAAIQLLDQIG